MNMQQFSTLRNFNRSALRAKLHNFRMGFQLGHENRIRYSNRFLIETVHYVTKS